MQDESVWNVDVEARLEKLRQSRGLAWKELAKFLGVTYTMLYFVRSGKRQLGIKSLHRLRQAEIEAGLRPAAQPTRPLTEEDKDRDFAYEQFIELRRRWRRCASDRDVITVAVRLLFPAKADLVLSWLAKKRLP